MSELRGEKSLAAFLALVRAGLWEKEVRLGSDVEVDYATILKLAQEQSVVGLVAAGFENSVPYKLPLTEKLKYAGLCLQIEQRNTAMNFFIRDIVEKMNDDGVRSLLVKGQGLAQCYEKPQWRASGDIDFLLDQENYKHAIGFLKTFTSKTKYGGKYSKETSFTIGTYTIEAHGTLRAGLSSRIDKVVDEVQEDTFINNRFRIWHIGQTEILLPAPDSDLFLVFTHLIKHFYKGGMNLRQICDLCRLLWAFKGRIDSNLLEYRLRKAGLMCEWKVFSTFAVDALGMTVEEMPLYEEDERWRKKGKILSDYILQNRNPNKMKNTMAIARVFPKNTLLSIPSIFLNVNRLKIEEQLFGR